MEWVAIPTPGSLSNPRVEPTSPTSPALAGIFFTTETTVKPDIYKQFTFLGITDSQFSLLTLKRATRSFTTPVKINFKKSYPLV